MITDKFRTNIAAIKDYLEQERGEDFQKGTSSKQSLFYCHKLGLLGPASAFEQKVTVMIYPPAHPNAFANLIDEYIHYFSYPLDHLFLVILQISQYKHYVIMKIHRNRNFLYVRSHWSDFVSLSEREKGAAVVMAGLGDKSIPHQQRSGQHNSRIIGRLGRALIKNVIHSFWVMMRGGRILLLP